VLVEVHDHDPPVGAVGLGTQDLARQKRPLAAVGPDGDPVVLADPRQPFVPAGVEPAEQVRDLFGLRPERRHPVVVVRGLQPAPPLARPGKESEECPRWHLKHLFEASEREQRLLPLRAATAVLPVAERRQADRDPLARQPLLDAFQAESPGADRGAEHLGKGTGLDQSNGHTALPGENGFPSNRR
jgi:hypothetical protein